VKDGIEYLLGRGTIKVGLSRGTADGISIDFYALTEFSTDRYTDKGRLDFILEHWPIYKAATGDKTLCGDVLESLVDKALAECPEMIRIGEPGKTFNNLHVDGVQFANSPPIDHVVYLREQGLILGLEDKNWREWVYPNDEIIPKLLRKCLGNGHVPVLIARKLPYITRLVFKAVGILGFETHFMYLHPVLESKFELIRHKDGLGFADLRFTADPPRHLVHFLQTVLPKEISTTATTFAENRSLIESYLGEQTSYYEFMSKLGIFPEIEEPEEGGFLDYAGDAFEPF
jgi:hypothetical protein